MYYDDWLNEKIDKSITEKDRICANCEFNFSGICADVGSLWGYGNKINDDSLGCDHWGISLHFYAELADKVEKKG